MDEDYKLFVWFGELVAVAWLKMSEIWKPLRKDSSDEKGRRSQSCSATTLGILNELNILDWITEQSNIIRIYETPRWKLFCHYSECRSTQMFTSSQHNEFWPTFRTAFKTCNVRPRWQTRAQSLPWGESKFVPKKTRRKKQKEKQQTARGYSW